jgi:alcohol dehydrogenase
MRGSQSTLAERLRFKLHRAELKATAMGLKLMPLRESRLHEGLDATHSLAREIGHYGVNKVLIVTTAGVVKRQQLDTLIAALAQNQVGFAIYSGITPDPSVSVVKEGLQAQQQHQCDAVVAFGGGSAIDASKAIVVAATNDKPVEKLVGIRKGRNKPLPLFCVPTTAGTGSEVTSVAVISDDVTHTKRFIIDSRTIAKGVALDPALSQSLPPSITAETGMDALTHAIEAYLSQLASPQTDALALEAIELIFTHLPEVYRNGGNLESRAAMARASLIAGKAFRKAMLGYVHAISHQLGACYGLPHGFANAILLPRIVAFSQDAVQDKLAQLAIETGLGEASLGRSDLAGLTLDRLERLNTELGIPDKVESLKEQDIPSIASAAYKEALSVHAGPKYMGRKDIQALLRGLLPQ